MCICKTFAQAENTLLQVRPQVVTIGEWPGPPSVPQCITHLKFLLPGTSFLVLRSNIKRYDVGSALMAGALGYLVLPSNLETVADAVQTVCSGQPFLCGQALPHLLRDLETLEGSEADRPGGLTERELEIVSLLKLGLSYKDIAGQLGITSGTVHAHTKRSFKKLKVHNRHELRKALLALQNHPKSS
jgi:DNA-binding NarL/FixJ family response regulator